MPHPVVIIGAGPIGLAGAAHAQSRGLDTIVLEAGPSAGAAAVEDGAGVDRDGVPELHRCNL